MTSSLPTQTPVAPGTTGQVLRFRVDNLGNGAEAFLLVANNAVTGDNFDPVAASPAIYLDTGGGVATNGVFDATDVPYVPGSNDPNLTARRIRLRLSRQQHPGIGRRQQHRPFDA